MEGLRVPGTLDALDAIADYVKRVAQSASLDDRAAYRLRLAVDEIATNVITHGYQEAGLQGDIQLQAELTPETLIIHMDDTGITYDPAQSVARSELFLTKDLDQRPIGGLGVFLAIQSVDRFIYQRHDGYNRNSFVIYRRSA
ncbi:MAG: anti-sigma regulatory factor [Thermostichales cyanobacterium HHBFW_bins_127]